jgi:hypothetical protein
VTHKTAKFGFGLALLLGSGAVAADPLAIVTTPSGPTQTNLYGSDTLNQVADIVLASLRSSGAVTQITTYGGIGSSGGQRQLEGSPSATEPTCTPTDGNGAPESNPGCQEISPMSRHLTSSICEDEVTSGTNGTAEGLAVCIDGLVVLTNNAAHMQFADATCPTVGATPNGPATAPTLPHPSTAETGKIRWSGTTPGGYTIGGGRYAGTVNGWKDVLRTIYGGCLNTETNAQCAAVDRVTRGNRPHRVEIVNNWSLMVASNAALAGEVAGNVATDCNGATANACTALRQAYRRDDSSGTTGVFVEILELPAVVLGRARLLSTIGQIQAVPANHPFVDGGDQEGFWPNADPATTYGDPQRRPCRAEDDLCFRDGTIGIVRAIRSTREGGYPPNQCTRGRFARQQFLASARAICPDGTVPSAGRCWAPYYAVDRNGDGDNTDVGDRDFNCLNDLNSRPVTVPGIDGRAYNYLWRTADGVLEFVPGAEGVLPEVAQWRQNMMDMDVVLPVPGGARPAVCQEADATRNIGCLVGNTICTIGFAGREAVVTAPYDSLQEAFRLQNRDLDAGEPDAVAPSNANLLPDTAADLIANYPFARDLFINAIGGAENITADCLARGGSAAYCADQVAIWNEFYNMTPLAQNACSVSGYIPYTESRCQGAVATATCGAPTTQAKTECLADDPAAAP